MEVFIPEKQIKILAIISSKRLYTSIIVGGHGYKCVQEICCHLSRWDNKKAVWEFVFRISNVHQGWVTIRISLFQDNAKNYRCIYRPIMLKSTAQLYLSYVVSPLRLLRLRRVNRPCRIKYYWYMRNLRVIWILEAFSQFSILVLLQHKIVAIVYISYAISRYVVFQQLKSKFWENITII